MTESEIRDAALRNVAAVSGITPSDAARTYARLLVHMVDAYDRSLSPEPHGGGCLGCNEARIHASFAGNYLADL